MDLFSTGHTSRNAKLSYTDVTSDIDLDNADHFFETMVRSKSSSEKTVVDLGCGDGLFAAKMAVFSQRVIGIEPGWTFHTACQRCDQSPRQNLQFRQENVHRTSLGKQCADIVISRYTPAVEAEAFRLLKPKGQFMLLINGERDLSGIKTRLCADKPRVFMQAQSESITDDCLNAGFARAYSKNFFSHDQLESRNEVIAFLRQQFLLNELSKTNIEIVDDYCDAFPEQRILLNRHRIILVAHKSP